MPSDLPVCVLVEQAFARVWEKLLYEASEGWEPAVAGLPMSD